MRERVRKGKRPHGQRPIDATTSFYRRLRNRRRSGRFGRRHRRPSARLRCDPRGLRGTADRQSLRGRDHARRRCSRPHSRAGRDGGGTTVSRDSFRGWRPRGRGRFSEWHGLWPAAHRSARNDGCARRGCRCAAGIRHRITGLDRSGVWSRTAWCARAGLWARTGAAPRSAAGRASMPAAATANASVFAAITG